MQPEIELGPLALQTFGLSLGIGFVGLGLMVARRLREIGKPVDWAYESVIAAAVGGIVGARIDWVLQNRDQLEHGLLDALVTGPGLVFYGGLAGGAIGVILWARWRRFLEPRLLDLAAPAIALGYAVGRIGCQLAGDGDYGIPSDLPWAMSYPDGTVPTTVEVHPTPLYETLVMGAATVVLWHLRNRFRPGVLFGIYLLIAGAERFLIEFIRRNEEVVAGLTLPQLIAVALVVAGAGLITALTRRPSPAPA